MTTSYVFVLGRTPHLAYAEIRAIFPEATIRDFTSEAILLENLEITPQETLNRLGGTIKIARFLTEVPQLTLEFLSQLILQECLDNSFTFGVSTINEAKFSKSSLAGMKDIFESLGKKTRFVEAREGTLLSSAVVRGQQVKEFLLVKTDKSYIIGHVEAIQDIEEWSKRDYGRPQADAKNGMLPPKVARMVVNLGLGDNPKSKKLLDPFCGMGTILAESYLTGVESFGSDIDAEVIKKAKENCSWLMKEYPAVAIPPKCQVCDAVHVSEKFPAEFFDVIVTEPFLGSPSLGTKQKLSKDVVKNTVKGLEKLYIGCLKDWEKILKPRGIIVMALPAFAIEKDKYFVKKVVDSCENFGYSIKQGPLEYSRPEAVVSRNFFVFQKG